MESSRLCGHSVVVFGISMIDFSVVRSGYFRPANWELSDLDSWLIRTN